MDSSYDEDRVSRRNDVSTRDNAWTGSRLGVYHIRLSTTRCLNMQPLDDITVVDLSITLPGPYGTKLLERLGAEVLKIEPPGGDPLKHRGPTTEDGVGAIYAALNDGKRCFEIDLKTNRGTTFVQDIASTADVFVEGFRPGVVDRLEVGPGELRNRNDSLIYCSVSGFGQDGPRRNQPAHDLNYQALAGVLDPADPSLPELPVSDFASGTMLVVAILTALRHRDRGGSGQYIDLALYDVTASWNTWNVIWAESEVEYDRDPLISGEYPCYNTYRTKDGQYLTVAIMEEHFWRKLCQRLEVPELVERQFDNGGQDSAAYARLQEVFDQRTLASWNDALSEEFPVTPVRPAAAVDDSSQAPRSEHAFAVDETTGKTLESLGVPISFGGNTTTTETSSDHLLEAAGYDDTALTALKEADILSESGVK